jgi:hypothetical protein
MGPARRGSVKGGRAGGPKGVPIKPGVVPAETVTTILGGAGAEGATGKVGRPGDITPGLVVSIAEKIGLGMPERYACAFFGISIDAWNKAKQRKPEILDAVDFEKAKFMFAALTVISTGMDGAKGCQWILQCRHKEHFAANGVVVEQNVNVGVPFGLTQEALNELQACAKRNFLENKKA